LMKLAYTTMQTFRDIMLPCFSLRVGFMVAYARNFHINVCHVSQHPHRHSIPPYYLVNYKITLDGNSML
jgi:hypothetical protein